MLSRRDFLVTLVFTPLIHACTSSDSGSTAPPSSCDGAGETSTVTEGHTHTLCVPAAALGSPADGGETFTTSTANGHIHDVTFTQAQLMSVAQGGSVVVTTSTTEGHTHAFTVQASAATPTPIPMPTSTPYY